MTGNFYKVNHGRSYFSDDEWQTFLTYKVIVVAGDYEIERLGNMNFGDYFYLTHSNRNGEGLQLIGKIIDSVAVECPLKENWWQRNYEPIIKVIPNQNFYVGDCRKKWTPSGLGGHGEGTIFQIPKQEESDFEQEILIPYFGITLAQLF